MNSSDKQTKHIVRKCISSSYKHKKPLLMPCFLNDLTVIFFGFDSIISYASFEINSPIGPRSIAVTTMVKLMFLLVEPNLFFNLTRIVTK